MTHEEFVDEVAAHAGLRGADEAERAIGAVLATLAERLSHSEAEALAAELPPRLTEPLHRGHFDRDFDRGELYARVARAEHVSAGFAVEHTLSVCQVVAEAIAPLALDRLRRALPDELASLFTPRPATIDVPPHAHATRRANTLATGRPGSTRPISEARPDLGQTESVVRAANPHEDTKLSSTRGLTQEREGETLATGHPGSTRPLSEGR